MMQISSRSRVDWPVAWPRIALLGFTVAVLLCGVKMVLKAEKPSDLGTLTRTAFLRWRPQLQELERGTDIYRAFNYPNPPIMALTLLPFTHLPRLPSALLWFALKVGMATACIIWSARLAQRPGTAWHPGLACGVALLALHPILGDLSHGNINIYIAFLVIGGIELFRRGYEFPAGLVWALAAASKVTPILFFPYMIWKGAYRTALAMLVGLGLFLLVIPSAALGWERNQTLLSGWYEGMVHPFLVEGKITTELANQSIPGVVHRLFSAAPSDVAYDEDNKPIPADYHTVLDFGTLGAKRIVQVCQALFVVLGMLLLRTPFWDGRIPRQGVRLAAEFGVVALGMLLFSERTWKHHAVVLVVPYAAILAALLDSETASSIRRMLIALLAMTIPLGYGPSLIGGTFQDECLAYGSQTLVFLLLTVGCLRILWEGRRHDFASSSAVRHSWSFR